MVSEPGTAPVYMNRFMPSHRTRATVSDRIRSAPSATGDFNAYLEVYHELIAEVGLAPSGKPDLTKGKGKGERVSLVHR